MSDTTSISYICQRCDYENVWSRDEILRAGERVLYLGALEDEMDIYSLPCKNPARPRCPGRHKVGMRREEGT